MDGRRFGILMTQVAACLGLSLAGSGTAQLAHAQTDSCAASVSGSFTHASGGSLLANLLGPMAGGESSSAGTLNQGACSPGEPASVSLQGPGTLAGNPVDLLSGAKLQRTVDGSWGTSSGVSLDDAAVLVVSRFHVKGQASSTALGPGWRLGLDTRLHAVPGPGEPDLQIVQGDGRVVRFGRGRRDMSGAVRHEALIREDGVLEQSKTAKLPWLWQWRSGRRLSFDEQGRLRRIDSPASAALGLTYDTRGRLSEVASANGRAIGLRYPVASQAAFPDRLSEVWLPGGGRVRYRYDLAGRLSRVARADGSEISYRYVDGDRKSTRLNSSHSQQSRMPSSA